jgi:glycerol-3-phosphate acyltransferase PlsY
MDWGLALRIAGVAIVAYLLGGISWALIIGKRFYGVDVREFGSGNLGATNVLRALGLKAAIATFVLDAAKGSAAAGLAWFAVPASVYGEAAHTWAMIVAVFAVVLGHSYSPYIKFRGGKGIATAAGALIVFTPYPLLILLAVFVVIVAVTRIVSLGSVIVAFGYPFMCWVFYPGDWAILAFSCVAAGLVLWRHQANIVRICHGEEPKIDFRSRGAATKEKGHS